MRKWLIAELSGGGSKSEEWGVGERDGRERTGLDAGGVAR